MIASTDTTARLFTITLGLSAALFTLVSKMGARALQAPAKKVDVPTCPVVSPFGMKGPLDRISPNCDRHAGESTTTYHPGSAA